MSLRCSPARAALAVAVALGCLCTGLAGWMGTAGAVQTATFSLTPTGERTSIVVFSRSGLRTDHFVLRNLKSRPIAIALQVLSLTKTGSAFHAGAPGVGFSSNVSLTETTVRLAAHQSRILPVRIDTDYDSQREHFAVIDAHQVTSPKPGTVAPHLQLAIELKPAPPRHPANPPSSTGTDVLLGVAAALILAALLSLGLSVRRRIRSAR